MTPLHFLLVCFAGWMNQRQQLAIEYLQEEIRVLQQQLGKPPRFNDDQRRRLAAKAKPIGRKVLALEAQIGSPTVRGTSPQKHPVPINLMRFYRAFKAGSSDGWRHSVNTSTGVKQTVLGS
jgi:hypothetical protein